MCSTNGSGGGSASPAPPEPREAAALTSSLVLTGDRLAQKAALIERSCALCLPAVLELPPGAALGCECAGGKWPALRGAAVADSLHGVGYIDAAFWTVGELARMGLHSAVLRN
eukprot:1160786-Pelagomonas_calceolata.AAC.6